LEIWAYHGIPIFSDQEQLLMFTKENCSEFWDVPQLPHVSAVAGDRCHMGDAVIPNSR